MPSLRCAHTHAVELARVYGARSGLYSEPATLYNDEAMLVVGSPYSESGGVQVDAAECAQIADFFATESERIRGLSEPWQRNP